MGRDVSCNYDGHSGRSGIEVYTNEGCWLVAAVFRLCHISYTVLTHESWPLLQEFARKGQSPPNPLKTLVICVMPAQRCCISFTRTVHPRIIGTHHARAHSQLVNAFDIDRYRHMDLSWVLNTLISLISQCRAQMNGKAIHLQLCAGDMPHRSSTPRVTRILLNDQS